MLRSHLVQLSALLCGLATLAACEPTPSEPNRLPSATPSETWQPSQPFYYFRPSRNGPDIRIPLELDRPN